MSATRLSQTLVFFPAGFASSIAQAGDNGAVGMVTHSPNLPAVPVLGGVGLVLLAALLGLFGVRMIRGDHCAGSKWLLAACLTTALASGTSGVKLISDAYALTSGVQIVTESGATLPMDESMFQFANAGAFNGGLVGTINVANTTDVLQYIVRIQLEPNCQIVPEFDDVNAGNGGYYEGPCFVQPPTALDTDHNCDLHICCEESGSEGICDEYIEGHDNGG